MLLRSMIFKTSFTKFAALHCSEKSDFGRVVEPTNAPISNPNELQRAVASDRITFITYVINIPLNASYIFRNIDVGN